MKKMKRLLAIAMTAVMSFSTYIPAMAANDLGVTYSATFDQNELTVSDQEQTVTMTVKSSKEFLADGIGFEVAEDEPLVVSAAENSNFEYDFSYPYFGSNTADTENVTIDLVAKLTITVPANTPAGEYNVGIKELVISKDYGESWEEGGKVSAKLIIKEAEAPHEHTPAEVVEAKYLVTAGDCENKAVYYKSCSECKEVLEDTFEGELGDHAYGTLVEKEAAIHTQTELKNGVEAHYQCSVCEKYFDADKNETTKEALTIEAKHTAGDWIVDKDATETEVGSKHKECTECGLVMETEEIPATGTGEDVVEPSVTLNKETLSLVVSDTEQLIATVEVPEGMAYALSWASDKDTVATVDEDGNVTAEGVGTATITVTLMPGAVPTAADEEGYPTASCLVTVTEKETEAKTYTVTVKYGSADKESYEAGETVTITAENRSGYSFDEWAGDVEFADKDSKTTTFVMPAENVEVEATYNKKSSGSSGGGGSTKYKVTLEDTDNGTVESSRTKASKGTTVTITVDPEAGYEVDDIVVETKAGKEVEVTDKGEGKFTFKMPAANVTVSVDFAKADVEDSDAKEEVEYIQLTIDSVIAWVFDEYVANDVAPVIRNGRTMLPARFVAEALGGTVGWNEAEQKVTIVKDATTLEIFIGEPFATVNGNPVELDSPAFIENSRTYLPIRFIAENLGATVAWDAIAQTVTITPGK